MQEFIELIKTAFFSQNNQQRSQAEQALVTLKTRDSNNFFTKCTEIFASSQLDSQTRVAAGTLLQRCIYFDHGWLSVSLEIKHKIKNDLLSQLISTDQNVKKSAARCISTICGIELPRNEWPDIIATLVQNTQHSEKEIKKAAILTLGYVCEALKNQRQSIQADECERILYGICLGLQADKEIILISLRSLQDSLCFMDVALKQQAARDHTTKLLIEQTISNDSEIRLKALQCLIDFSRTVFDYLDQYIQVIWQCTQESLNKQDFCIAAMEVWQSIASESVERAAISNRAGSIQKNAQKEIITMFQTQILQAILQNLVICEEDDDDDEQSIQEAAYKAASSLSEAIGSQCYQLFLTFVENTLQQQEWKKRKASLLAFSSLVETPDIDQLYSYSLSAINEFIKKINDPHIQVQKAAWRVINRIAENYPNAFLKNQQWEQYIQHFSQLLLINPANIVKENIWTLNYLTEAFKESRDISYNIYYKPLISQLAQVTLRQDITDPTVIDLVWSAILNILQCLPEISDVKIYLNDFGTQMGNYLSFSPAIREQMINGLLAAIHISFLRLIVLKDQPEEQLIKNFYQIIIGYFKNANCVNGDGFGAISALASYGRSYFESLAGDFIPNYLQIGLQQKQEPETFKGAILCLADIARALQEKIIPYIGVLDYLINCVNDQTINRMVQIQLFTCISDIILASEMASEPYYQRVMTLILKGFEVAKTYAQNRDQTQLEYYEALNECLLNSYLCLLHAYNSKLKHFNPMFNTLQDIYTFIFVTSDKSLTPTVEYIRNCIACLIDCIAYFRKIPASEQQLIEISRSPLIFNLIELLKKFKDNQDNLDTLRYAQEQLRLYGVNASIN